MRLCIHTRFFSYRLLQVRKIEKYKDRGKYVGGLERFFSKIWGSLGIRSVYVACSCGAVSMCVEDDWIGSNMCLYVRGDERENMGDLEKVKKLQS